MNRWRVRRERIIERLRRASGSRLTLIIAEAGFGKSVGLRQFLEADETPYALYRVPPETTTLLGFLRGLTESLETIVPGAHLSLAMAHERAMQSSSPFAELAVWFGEHLRRAAVRIVVDDLHNATAPAVADFLTRAIDAAPESVRWAIASRTALTFPIAPWLAQGETDWPIDETQLRFSEAEVAELARSAGRRLGPDAVGDIMRLTDGWPSAVGLAVARGDTLAGMPVSGSKIQTYRALARLVLAKHEEPVRDFLLKTAVFPEFDDELLRVAGWHPEPVLSALARDGGYIERLGEGTYRYDGLFREFLLEVLKEQGHDEHRDALVRAAAAYERVGRLAEALTFHRRAGARAAMTRSLVAHGFALMDAGSADVVEASIASLDEAQQDTNATIMALKAVLDSQRGRYDSSEAWFRLAIVELDDERLRLNIIHRYALDLFRRGRMDCIELLEPWVQSTSVDYWLYPLLCSTLATAYSFVDRSAEARALIERAIAGLDPSVPDAARARAYHQAAYVALRSGDVIEAQAYAERALEVAVPRGFYDLAARAHSVLYEIAHAFEANPRSALEHVEHVAAFALKSGDARVRQWALLAAYYIEAERGNAAMMDTIERSLNAAEVVQTTDEASAALLPGQALRATWSGDFRHAYRLLAHSAEQQLSADRRAERWAEIAMYGAAAGFLGEARKAVECARRELAAARSGKHSIQAGAYLLVTLSLLGEDMTWITVRRETRMVRPAKSLVALMHAAEILHEHWSEKRNHTGVLSAMEDLRTNDLGGIALLFEALPAKPARAARRASP